MTRSGMKRAAPTAISYKQCGTHKIFSCTTLFIGLSIVVLIIQESALKVALLFQSGSQSAVRPASFLRHPNYLNAALRSEIVEFGTLPTVTLYRDPLFFATRFTMIATSKVRLPRKFPHRNFALVSACSLNFSNRAPPPRIDAPWSLRRVRRRGASSGGHTTTTKGPTGRGRKSIPTCSFPVETPHAQY